MLKLDGCLLVLLTEGLSKNTGVQNFQNHILKGCRYYISQNFSFCL